MGNYYELTGAQVTKYYYAGAQRVAMRKYTIPQPMTVEYFIGDHLGSTSLTTDSNGAKVSEMRYTVHLFAFLTVAFQVKYYSKFSRSARS